MTFLQEETLAKKLISKGSLIYIFAFLIAPTGYVIRVLASNSMSVEEIGVFYSILGLITILAVYNDLGLTEALKYFLPKYWIKKQYNYYKTIWITTFAMQLVTGIIIGGLLWLGADWLAIHYFQSGLAVDMLKLFALYFMLINFFHAFASVYNAFQDVLYEQIVETLRMYGALFATLVFWFAGMLSVTYLGYAWMIGLCVALLVSTVLFIFKYGKTMTLGQWSWDHKIFKTQLGYAFWVFLGMNAGILLGQVDQQMIVVILGAQAAGYYTNYLSLFNMYGIFVFPFVGLMFPIVTELITKQHYEKVCMLLAILYKYFTVFGLMISGILLVLGPTIAGVLYGDQFVYSGELIRYAGFFVVLNILLAINFSVMAGMGRVRERVIILGWALGANILGNIVFMLLLGRGLPGAIVATVLGWSIMLTLTTRLVRREYVFGMDWWFVGRNAFVITLLSLGLWYSVPYFDWSIDVAWIVRVAYLAILVGVYTCVLLGINYRSIVFLWTEMKHLQRDAD